MKKSRSLTALAHGSLHAPFAFPRFSLTSFVRIAPLAVNRLASLGEYSS
jgi:hypothetical protein